MRAARRIVNAPATYGMRQPLSPMSANGSATTANEKPKPPASASIDAEYARAPSGASSITAMPATISVVLTNARWSICAPVKTSSVGATAETAHANAEPTTPRRIAARRPRRSASAVAKSARIAPDTRDRERDAERGVRGAERVADRVRELTEERARERHDRDRGRGRGEQQRLLVGRTARSGARARPRRLRAPGRPRARAAVGRPRTRPPGCPAIRVIGLKNHPKNGMSMPPRPARGDDACRRRRRAIVRTVARSSRSVRPRPG